ncbi:MAG: inverse autotransporter beta domain-containing protein [Candidatus Omnitrophica bacterium]|nr:inverse autotransporter beta domain-containing protein [Candidatus Omnitrophota bacterium]
MWLTLGAWTPRGSADSLPDFVEHWEFAWNVDEDQGPNFILDPIVPLYRDPSDDRVAFVEPRLSLANSEWLLNLGTGVRQLVLNRSWLLGANMFYDYETQYSHYRLGWGIEALSSYAEFRSNYYLALSQERLVEEVIGVSQRFQEAVNGYDFEIGGPIPYYSRLKLFGGFNWWNFEKFDNRYGWTLRAEYKPVPFVVIDGTVQDHTKSNVDWGLKVAFRIPFGGNTAPEKMRPPMAFDAAIVPESDASEFLWSLVERHHEIVVEQRLTTGSVTVEVARGT